MCVKGLAAIMESSAREVEVSSSKHGKHSKHASSSPTNPETVGNLRRVEVLRLLQGIVIAYDNMAVPQRAKVFLKDKAFQSLCPFLEVFSPHLFSNI